MSHQTEMFPKEPKKSFTQELIELLAHPDTTRMLQDSELILRDERKRHDYNRKRRKQRAKSKADEEALKSVFPTIVDRLAE